MTVEVGVYTILTGDATLSASVGTRVYGGGLPQEPAFPCVSFQVVSSIPDRTLGEKTADSYHSIFQIDVFADDYESSKEIAAKVRNALEGYKGSVGNVSIKDIWVWDAGTDNIDSSDALEYRVTAQYEVWHTV